MDYSTDLMDMADAGLYCARRHSWTRPAMAGLTEQERIVRQNYKAFRAELRWMLAAHDGEFVVLRNRKVIGFFTSPTDAWEFGEENFPDGRFSIQEVTDRKAFISPHVYAVRDGKA